MIKINIKKFNNKIIKTNKLILLKSKNEYRDEKGESENKHIVQRHDENNYNHNKKILDKTLLTAKKNFNKKSSIINITKKLFSTVKNNKINNNKINNNEMKNNKINNNKIKNNKINNNKIKNNKINNNEIKNNETKTNEMKNNKIKNNKIRNSKIKNNEMINNKIKNKSKTQESILKYNNFTIDGLQLKHSSALDKFYQRLKDKYLLKDYTDINAPALFFGIYNSDDLKNLKIHKGQKYIMWGGSDIDLRFVRRRRVFNYIKNFIKNVKHIAISKDIKNRLQKTNTKYIFYEINLVDKNIFRPVLEKGTNIYYYDGLTQHESCDFIYGKSYYDSVQKLLPEYNYIKASENNVPYDKMYDIYKECFIGLRLTDADGNANTVQELQSMNIPVVHNSSDYGLKWKDKYDISFHIMTHQFIYDFYKTPLTDANLSKIYKNIGDFACIIKEYKNILFICSDYPSYGGAATNCSKLQEFFIKREHNTYSIYYNFSTDKNKKYDKTKTYMITDENKLEEELKKIKFKPDLIVLKNFVKINLKKIFGCPIYYLIAGIYNDTLNKKYNLLTDKEHKLHINNNVLRQIKNSDKIFCNSQHTREILKNIFNIDTFLFYSSFVSFYGKTISIDNKFDNEFDNKFDNEFDNKFDNEFNNKFDNEFDKRKYNYGLVVSNFDRKIKNVEKSIDFLKNKTNVILIGKNSEKYNTTHECVSLIDTNDLSNYYKQIKYIVNDSHYESCSNVVLEAQYNGCKITHNHTILLLSTQYPFYGGAATLAYEFHKKLLDNNINSICVFFNLKKMNDTIVNPEKIKNVYSEKLISDYNCDFIKFYSELLLKINIVPNIIIGFNYVAPIIGKKLYDSAIVYYYVTGCKYISDSQISAQEYLDKETRSVDENDNLELYATNIVDYIIPNSYLTQNIFIKLYSNISHKMTDVITLEELFFKPIKVNQNKIYDIAIISSRYDRKVKNIDLINKIFSDPLLKNFNKVCIGKDSDKVIIDADKHFGFVTKSEVDDILSKTKLVLITSYYESMSISLIQAINNDCIVLSNKNVGGSIYLDKFYILDNYNSNEWVHKIETIINNYDYHKKLNTLKSQIINNPIESYKKLYVDNNLNKYNKHNIVFSSIDKPYEAGSATNTMNIINCYKNSKFINPIGLFFVNNLSDIDIYKYEINDIYFILINESIDTNIKLMIKYLNKKYKHIDLFFLKNYKSFIFISKYIDLSKIIYSPSGLRLIASHNDYYDKLDLSQIKNNINNNNNFYDNNLPTYEFVIKYDIYLEEYIFKKCQYILPNSELTRNCIANLYNSSYNLLKDINLTFIDFNSKKITTDICKKYDIAFVCYSWKRNVKNYNFIKEFIKMEKIKKLKILIIGKNQTIKEFDNITIIDSMPNDKLKELFKSINILCCNSYYDSSPNVIKEALQNGCKVLLTKNIGNYSTFNSKYLVDKYDRLEDWQNKVLETLKLKFDINDILKNTYAIDKTAQYLENIILSIINKKNNDLIKNTDNIGIYKLNPLWNSLLDNNSKLPEYTKITNTNIAELKIINKIFNYDLYFEYFINQFDGGFIKNNKNYHYVYLLHDVLKYPLFFNLKDKYPYIKNNIYIWFISNKEHLNLFQNKNKYYFRGNYYNIYNSLKKEAYCELYTATSLTYDKTFNQSIGEIIKYKFDKLLIDPDNITLYKQKFPNSNIEIYKKKPTTNFIYYGLSRDIDYIFVATETQITKNRHLFVDFICYCEKNKISVTIANVGKPDSYYLEKLNTLNYVTYISYDYLNTNELITLFNRTKINLLFSGRDSLPRVLIESLACGCYNIALDTITDGKYLYTTIFGQILSFTDVKKTYQSIPKSISYESDDKIFKKIISYKDTNFNHKSISLKFITS